MHEPPAFFIATADAPGAIGIVHLHGRRAAELVERLTGRAPCSRTRLVRFGDVDEGLVAGLPDGSWQLLPHGGVRVMRRLGERLIELGARPAAPADTRAAYPEAETALEADMLAALARAASPAAIDLLLDQPRRWRRALDENRIPPADEAFALADRLDRLVHPPVVVLAGRPNVGKSTLSNRVRGRAASITADLPGTTRDWVGGLAELPTPLGELAVRWLDTPGLRPGGDPIERHAIEAARGVIARADLLIAIRDPETDYPDPADLPREPDLHVLNKADLLDPAVARPEAVDGALPISALHGYGMSDLAEAIARSLALTGLDPVAPWAFSPALRNLLGSGDAEQLAHYVYA